MSLADDIVLKMQALGVRCEKINEEYLIKEDNTLFQIVPFAQGHKLNVLYKATVIKYIADNYVSVYEESTKYRGIYDLSEKCMIIPCAYTGITYETHDVFLASYTIVPNSINYLYILCKHDNRLQHSAINAQSRVYNNGTVLILYDEFARAVRVFNLFKHNTISLELDSFVVTQACIFGYSHCGYYILSNDFKLFKFDTVLRYSINEHRELAVKTVTKTAYESDSGVQYIEAGKVLINNEPILCIYDGNRGFQYYVQSDVNSIIRS